jgi:hypothetical protein
MEIFPSPALDRYADRKLLAAALALEAFTPLQIANYTGFDSVVVNSWLRRNAAWFHSVTAGDQMVVVAEEVHPEMPAEPPSWDFVRRVRPELSDELGRQYAAERAQLLPSLLADAEKSSLPEAYDPWAFVARLETHIARWRTVQRDGWEDLSAAALAIARTGLGLAWVRVNDFVLAGAVVKDHRLDRLVQWEVELGIVGPLSTVSEAHAFLEGDAADVARAQLTAILAAKRLAIRARLLGEMSFRNLLIAALGRASQTGAGVGGLAAALLDILTPSEIIASLRVLVASIAAPPTNQQQGDLEAALYGLATDPRISSQPMIAEWAFSLQKLAWWPALSPAVARLMATAGGDINLPKSIAYLETDLLKAFNAEAKEPAAQIYPEIWDHAKVLFDLHHFAEQMAQKIAPLLASGDETINPSLDGMDDLASLTARLTELQLAGATVTE